LISKEKFSQDEKWAAARCAAKKKARDDKHHRPDICNRYRGDSADVKTGM
jgi:hypothetical protein